MTASETGRNKAPLSTYRVLEIADEKGVYCGKLLAELGADTIKIEKPGGDDTRRIPPFADDDPHPEKGFFFLYYNQNKRGITLDLEHKEGQDLFRRLVRHADVVIESCQPGHLDSLGIGYSALSEINPRLIMTSITGFGQSGPYRDYRVTELVSFAMGGMFQCGEPSRPPCVSPVLMATQCAAIHAALATLIALRHRGTTGQGQHVDIAIHDVAATSIAEGMATRWFNFRELLTRQGSQHVTAPAAIYPCKDGHAYVVGGLVPGNAPGSWPAFLEWIGNPDVLADDVWGDANFRRQNIDVVNPFIVEHTMKHTKEELYREGQTRHFPVSPVQTPADFVDSAQTKARKFFVDVEHPVVGKQTYPGPPYKLAVPWRTMERPAPLVGQHNVEVYCNDLGMTNQELGVMRTMGVI
ncbi:MAG: CoA transferase [Chloroflexota bacterium]|nr:CoA transferase [Chloroflexota bacterium]